MTVHRLDRRTWLAWAGCVFLALASAGTSYGQFGCDHSDPQIVSAIQGNVMHFDGTIISGLEYWLEVDKLVYGPGEQVSVLQRITAIGTEGGVVAFGWSPGPGFNLLVYDGDELVWQAKEYGPSIPNDVHLAFGESIVETWNWPLVDSVGTAVAPGEYRLVGTWGTSGPGLSLNVTIVPEPGTVLVVGFLLAAGGLSRRNRG